MVFMDGQWLTARRYLCIITDNIRILLGILINYTLTNS